MSDDRFDQIQARIERLEAILARASWQANYGDAVRPRCNDPWREPHFPQNDKLPSSGGYRE
jgi:hypothetical protein